MIRIVLLIAMSLPGSVFAEELEDLIRNSIAPITKDRPNASVVVGVLDGNSERIFSFGKCEGKTADRHSIYEIGSITKTFTGILLADRVKAGIVRLDDPVEKHLPAGWKMPRRDDRDITLLQLATHSSSLPRGTGILLVGALTAPENPFSKVKMEEVSKDLLKLKPERAFGSKFEYSNLGMGLLGYALANASKCESYEKLLEERVLKPLELSQTSVAMKESQKANIVSGYSLSGKKLPPWSFAGLEACGSIRSSTDDLFRYIKANLNLPAELKQAIAMAREPWLEISPGRESICLGWFKRSTTGGKYFHWHNGGTTGFRTFLSVIPNKGGVVVLANVPHDDVDKTGILVTRQVMGEK